MANIDVEALKQDKELVEAIRKTDDPKELAELFVKKGFDVTEADIKKALSHINSSEFSEEDLENVTGGSGFGIALGIYTLIAIIAFGKGISCK